MCLVGTIATAPHPASFSLSSSTIQSVVFPLAYAVGASLLWDVGATGSSGMHPRGGTSPL